MLVMLNVTFLWEGIHITNPLMEETGRFEVVPSEHYVAEEGEMVVIYINNAEILLNYDGFNALMKELK